MYNNIEELVGNTPIVLVNNFCEHLKLQATIALKLENTNPAGSAKDRVALAIINAAEQSGQLAAGATIIEATSGNTGVALAAICAARGYRAVIVMPESMSIERRRLISAYGATVVLTPVPLGMQGAIDEARRLHTQTKNSFMTNQFGNPENPRIHYNTTGPEIWKDTKGQLAAFVAGVGTGGTLSGAGKYIKEQNPDVFVAAVEPSKSPILNGGKAAGHAIMGIGANFIPQNYDATVSDVVLDITEEDAYEMARLVAKTQGILLGISSGAALAGAVCLARQERFKGKLIVAIAVDTGERYLSTPLFDNKS